jgi:hypothetical protein
MHASAMVELPGAGLVGGVHVEQDLADSTAIRRTRAVGMDLVDHAADHLPKRGMGGGAIARLGGYLDRKSDGPPGWQTLWKGWMRVMDVLEGVHLAALLHPP